MADRPILFSGPMVRAILQGRKTQTRRAILPKPWNSDGDCVDINIARSAEFMRGADGRHYFQFEHPRGGPLTAYVSPYAPGDRLWVRETLDMGFAGGFPICTCTYASDGSPVDLRPAPYWAGDQRRNVIPSMFMPRWASRLTLIVESVKIERLQDMEGQHPSESDAIAEGVNSIHHGDGEYYYSAFRAEPHPENWIDPTDAFMELWDSINAKRPGCAWADNPWVAAITFRAIKANIDSSEARK